MTTLAYPRQLLVFAGLSLADLGLTWFLLERTGGRAYETNPVASWWLAGFGWPGLAAFKLAIVLLVAVLTQVVSRHRPRAGGRVLAFGCSAVLAVVLYSGLLVRGVAAEAGATAGADITGADDAVSENYEPPDEALETVDRRAAARERLAAEVAEGRLPLLEAAARYRDLDAAATEEARRAWRLAIEASSDEERYCRQVLQHVSAVLQDRPGESAAVLPELAAQLDECLRRGEVRLPD